MYNKNKMTKADNFDAGKWLVENKMTTQSKLNEEVSDNVKQFLSSLYFCNSIFVSNFLAHFFFFLQVKNTLHHP